MRKTKIVCTLGPSTDDESVLRQMMLSGMNIARFNFSHQTYEDHKRRLDMLKKLRKELNLPIPALLDTKGPEIRIGLFKNKSTVLKEGQQFTLTTRDVEGDNSIVSVSFKGLPEDVSVGNHILIDDGLIDLVVEQINGTDVICTVLNGGKISNNKGVNLPGVKVSLPFVSEKDRNDLLFGIKNGFDFVAASFTQTPSDIIQIKSILENNGGSNIRVIAKIENAEGVENIDEILKVADGVMVARGDMGVEIPFEEIPRIQKMLIKKGYNAGKLVITATQMLDSMTVNPRPTRAEVTDVANAIYDGTSAIMLSSETAAGKYPVEVVKTMSRIAERTESDIDYAKKLAQRKQEHAQNVTNAISHATCTTAQDLGAAAILTVTKSGQTARFISKYRPTCPIIGCTPDEQVYRQLNLSWGVIPLMTKELNNTDELFDNAVGNAVKNGLLKNGDLVVITAGVPLGVSGTTNLMKVQIVGNALVRGHGIVHASVCGNLCVCKDEAEAREKFREGDIIVIPKTSNAIMPLIKKSSGIIAEQDGISSHAAVVGFTLDLPVIVGAKGATQILKSGTTVILDGTRGIVFNGGKKQKLEEK
jgi:pyruvate kinase